MEKRGRFSSQEKVQILLESFSKETSVTDICKKYGLHPNLYYQCPIGIPVMLKVKNNIGNLKHPFNSGSVKRFV